MDESPPTKMVIIRLKILAGKKGSIIMTATTNSGIRRGRSSSTIIATLAAKANHAPREKVVSSAPAATIKAKAKTTFVHIFGAYMVKVSISGAKNTSTLAKVLGLSKNE